MTFKPRIWYPIAAVLSVLNVVAVGFAAAAAEPWHATAHAGLALGFGLWALHLRRVPARREEQPRLEALEADMLDLREELVELQERLDFTERILAQRSEARRVGPEG